MRLKKYTIMPQNIIFHAQIGLIPQNSSAEIYIMKILAPKNAVKIPQRVMIPCFSDGLVLARSTVLEIKSIFLSLFFQLAILSMASLTDPSETLYLWMTRVENGLLQKRTLSSTEWKRGTLSLELSSKCNTENTKGAQVDPGWGRI